MDLYLCSEKQSPIVFYVHGGGFTWGDKAEGDPNAKGKDGDQLWYFNSFLKAGYHVASVNYALAPEYKYPVPVIQLRQALEFLNKNGKKYGLDTENYIFVGSSAGGQLIGQLANIETNPDYARKLQMKPVLKSGTLKACLFNSSLLDCGRYDVTHQAVFDFILLRCGRAYFGCRKMLGDVHTKEASVIPYVTGNFPPAFVSDGNYMSFYDQARDFVRRLTEKNVCHDVVLIPREKKKLGHGYESIQNEYGLHTMEMMLSFLEKEMK